MNARVLKATIFGIVLATALTPVAARADPIEDGLGAEQDNAAARRNLGIRVAAEQGSAVAQNTLGFMYQHGRGAPRNLAEALRWYRLSAGQGFGLAFFNLGGMYATGRGVPQDFVEAHKWCDLAASRVTGDRQKEYAETRDALAKQMTPAQLAEAQRLARDWQAVFEKRQPD